MAQTTAQTLETTTAQTLETTTTGTTAQTLETTTTDTDCDVCESKTATVTKNQTTDESSPTSDATWPPTTVPQPLSKTAIVTKIERNPPTTMSPTPIPRQPTLYTNNATMKSSTPLPQNQNQTHNQTATNTPPDANTAMPSTDATQTTPMPSVESKIQPTFPGECQQLPGGSNICFSPNPSRADDGFPEDAYAGWYSLDGSACCNDYCRWVGDSGPGGDPAITTVMANSYWACRPSSYTYCTYFTDFAIPFAAQRCSGQGVL